MREKRTSVKKSAANRAIQEAKTMIRAKNFKSAITKVEEATSLYTHIPNGQEMLTVCEFLHKSETFKPQPDRETWPYDLLQIPTSSTASQVVTRYDELTRDLVLAKNSSRFLSTSRANLALDFLHQTMSVYNRKNSVLSDVDTDDDDDGGDDDDDDCGDSAAVDEEENSDDDPAQPRVLPFSRYCPSIKREIRLVFDVIYLRLIGKLQNLDDNLSDEEENTIGGELSNLEEMGYDVVKLKERFVLLMRVKVLGMLDQSNGEMRQELKGKISSEKVPRRIARFKRYDGEIKVQHHDLKLELARVKSLLRTTKADLCDM